MSTVKVKYVGRKPVKFDNVAGTNTVWNGPGDVQEVTPEVWTKLSKHEGVWELDGQEPAKPQDSKPPQGEPKYVLVAEGRPDVVLDTMSLADLKAFATANNIEFNAKTKDPLKLAAEIHANATKA
jgi:hypothetical protein